MASFSDAWLSWTAVCFYLFLIVAQQHVPSVRAQILQDLGSNLGSSLASDLTSGLGSNLISNLESLESSLASTLDSGLGSNIASNLENLYSRSESSPVSVAALLSSINVVNPFNLPGLPMSVSDIPEFSREALQSILGPVVNLTATSDANPQVEDLLKSAADQDPEAIATVGVLSSVFLEVSSILFTVSGGLAVEADTVVLASAGLGTIAGPISVLLSADELQLQIRNDAHASTNTFYTAWSDSLGLVADKLSVLDGSGGVHTGSNLSSLRAQLAQVHDLLQTAIGNYISNN